MEYRMATCPYCSTPIEAELNFCVGCERQVKCLQCGKALYRDKRICLVCGMTVGGTAPHDAVNRYSYREEYTPDTGSRSIELSLTDYAVKEAAPLFGERLPPLHTNGDRFPSGAIRNRMGIAGSPPTPTEVLEAKLAGEPSVEAPEANEERQSESPPVDGGGELTQMFDKDSEGCLIPKHPDYKGKSKREQQERFIILYVAAYALHHSGANPTKEHIFHAASKNSLFDRNLAQSYFPILAKTHLVGVDGNFTLNTAGRIRLVKILDEMRKDISGYAYWEPSTRSGAVRSRIGKDDRTRILEWVQKESRCSAVNIRKHQTAHELAMFAIYDLTKELKFAEAVKPAVAYEYLKERYKTIPISIGAFTSCLCRKAHAGRFKKTEDGLYYLTPEAEEVVESWIRDASASESGGDGA